MIKKSLFLSCLCLLALVASAKGDSLDPLHGFCAGCSDNGTNTPTSSNPLTFGINISPGPQTGVYVIDFLVANSFVPPLSNAVTGTVAGTATQFSSTAWTSGFLDSYLGLSGGASPANGIGAYLPSELAL